MPKDAVLGVVHDRAGRGPAGDQGADGPVRGLVTAAGPVGRSADRRSAHRGQVRGFERQGGPDHLAAARGVLDVADPARLQGDLAHQQQPAAAGLPVVGLQGGGAVGVVVLHGDPHPLRADGDLDGELGREQRRVPHGVGDQLGDDQQQPLDEVVRDRHALTVQQVPYGVPGLRDRDVDGGGGEPPDPLVRQWLRRPRVVGSVPAALQGVVRLPRPWSSIVRSPPLRSIVTTCRVLVTSALRTGGLNRSQRVSTTFGSPVSELASRTTVPCSRLAHFGTLRVVRVCRRTRR